MGLDANRGILSGTAVNAYLSILASRKFAHNMVKAEVENSHRLSYLNKNLIFGTWIWYSVEDRLLFSESFCQMACISKDSYYNFSTFFEIIHGEDLLPFLSDIENMLEGAAPQWIDLRIVRPDNTVQKVNCFIESMSTEFGDVFDITGICIDVNP